MTEDVLIVDALSAGTGQRRSSRDSIGCGPRSVAGVMESNNINCRITRVEALIQTPGKVRRFDHVAISAMSMDLPVVKQVISLWRKNKSKGRVLLGGPIASDPTTVLRETKPDVLIIGEGEATLSELLKKNYLTEKIRLSEITGIGYVEKKQVHITVKRPLLSENELWIQYSPSTTRVIDYPAYQASRIYVETVRGCSNFRRTRLKLPDGRECSECGGCDAEDPQVRLDCPEDIPPGGGFCSVPSIWGFPRSRPADMIVREIKELLELGVHKIVLEAPDFLDYMREGLPLSMPCSPEANIPEIVHLLKRITDLPEMKSGTAYLAIENMKSCLFTEDVARSLSGILPSTSPNIGLETGSETHSKLIGKCGSPKDVVRSIRLAREFGMSPFVYFIYGLPGETEETVDESIKIMKQVAEAGAERIILYGFRPLPESAFADFPSPAPSNPFAERLRDEANRINNERKQNFIGLVIRGIAAEPSWDRYGFTMVYPISEGPIMTVEGGYSAGTLLDVRITDILSPGLLLGDAVNSEV